MERVYSLALFPLDSQRIPLSMFEENERKSKEKVNPISLLVTSKGFSVYQVDLCHVTRKLSLVHQFSGVESSA